MSRPPSLYDVAAHAGVSHQTVSRVINGSTLVKETTRGRVQLAIDELGYRPNLSARALATSTSQLIAIVASGFSLTGPAAILASIEADARALGLTAAVGVLTTESRAEAREVFDTFAAHGVRGTIVIAPTRASAALLPHGSNTPTVLVTQPGPHTAGHPFVAVDQRLGSRLATERLIARGARSIVHVSGPLHWFDAASRLDGWRGAMAAAGLPAPEPLEGDWSAETGNVLGHRIAAGPLPDAILCANDLMAIGILAALRDAGIRVPDDVALIGYDDLAGTAYLDPPLTTVRQPFEKVGRAALESLVAAVAGERPADVLVAPELIARVSG